MSTSSMTKPAATSTLRVLPLLVFFDEETEEICREQGYTLILPPDSLRRRLDSKIVTTQLGNEAGAPSVPNVLGHAGSYAELTALAAGAGLGGDLVVQTPYGDSGKTTFFIKSEPDWDEFAAGIDGQAEWQPNGIRPGTEHWQRSCGEVRQSAWRSDPGPP